MSKFVENSMIAMAKAMNDGQAKKAFDTSCELCASKNILHCACDNCPVAAAYAIRTNNFKILESLYEKALA